jgi:hypothetical protein
MALDVEVLAGEVLGALTGLPLGAMLAVWADGTLVAYGPDDIRLPRRGVPLLTFTGSSRLPTLSNITARLRAAATLRGILPKKL